MPDDGRRYELINGVLIVTPSPEVGHQRVQLNAAILLKQSCPEGFEVFVAPLDVVLDRFTALQPDILVVRSEQATGERLAGVPVVAVEVLSPSTRSFDLGPKLTAYATAGVAHSWVIDPNDPVTVIVFELEGDTYGEVARASGDEHLDITAPFPVTIIPSRLLSG